MSLFVKTFVAYVKHFLGLWNEPKRYRQLYSLISEIRAKNIMEIGTWKGERARLMILEAQKNFPGREVSYYGFDLFEDLSLEILDRELSKQPPTMEAVRSKLDKTGAKILLYKGDTKRILPEIASELPKMDFIFIDGGHSLETIQNDWNWASRLMHDKTVVIFDDYWPERTDAGAKPVIDAIDRSIYDVKILAEFDVFIKGRFKRLIIKFALVRKHRYG
ncbi:MAG: class I SAM-dependent methyltransferase [Parcubacteria group bacterium]|nr:class I SAM-dependent methyltransferase [Parcubacteria group bacterium]